MEENQEMQLLGLLAKKPELISECSKLISFENPFSGPRLNAIFSNIQKQYNESGAVDRRILARDTVEFGVDRELIFSLSKSAGFALDIAQYVENVCDGLIKQKLTSMSHYVVNCTTDDLNNAEDYLKICRDTVEEIEKKSAVTTGVTVTEAIQEIYEKAEALAEGKTDHYLKTGILALDRLIMGLTTKTMSVMAARPSVGKTAFGLTVMSNMMSQGIGCGFISVEMSEAECIERIAQVRSNVSIYDFASGLSVEGQKAFYGHLDYLAKCPNMQIERTINRKISNIRSIARKMKTKNPKLKVIFIDYLQKILGDDPRQDKKSQIDMVSAILTDIATDLDVHICCMAQLNRDGDDAPKLRHLKDSGCIEQDAHYAFLIHRDLTEQHSGNYDSTAFVGVAKNRGGKTGNLQIRYNGKTTRFYDEVTEEAFG